MTLPAETVCCSCATPSVSLVVGVAATVPVDQAADFLASLDHALDRVRSGPVALGCVPFVPGSTAALVVPSVQFRKDAAGIASVTTVGDVGDDVVTAALHSRESCRRQPQRVGRSNRRSTSTPTSPQSPLLATPYAPGS